MNNDSLGAFFGRVKRFLRGERLRPSALSYCHACGDPFTGAGFYLYGRRYCSKACAPAALRIAGDPR
jgi:hypothetical protein